MVTSTATFIRLKATLVDSEPPIWRELDVDALFTLYQVHVVLQTAFDWQNAHLHCFSDDNPEERSSGRILRRVPVSWGDESSLDEGLVTHLETEATLGQVLSGVSRTLVYEYDFGDGWLHLLEFIERTPRLENSPGAILLRGERRGPLEDSGALSGYYEKLAVLADPTAEEHEEIAEWVAYVSGPWRSFTPNELAVEVINAELAATFPPAIVAAAAPPSLASRVLDKFPPGVRRDFRSYLDAALAGGPATVDDEMAEDMLHPYLWLIRRVGIDGIPLSAAGWMPSEIVSDAMRDLDWEWRWYGKMNRENQTIPVLRLRESATRLGLLRKVKGRLMLTVAARKCLTDAQALWNLVAKGLAHLKTRDSVTDATALYLVEIASGHIPQWQDSNEPIIYGLGVLGWRSADNLDDISVEVARNLVDETWRVLDIVGAFERAGERRWMSTGVAPGGQAFARAILLA